MKTKWMLLITLGLALILAVPALTGCGSPSVAQGTASSVQISQQPQGIWVSGTGEVAVTPDIATLRVDIVAQESTVAVAQSKASEAMTKVMKALADSGIAQKDIQTRSFSIQQLTRYDKDKQQDVVIGYQVSNTVNAKIRAIDKAGAVIDAVAKAGGNLTRINGISFSIDDPTAYYKDARQKAMTDAKAKAEQLAGLAGVALGKPTYITENSYMPAPIYRDQVKAVPAPLPAGVPSTPVSPGEMEITINVQVAYATQ